MNTVWITGGTRGIGKATAETFLEQGYRVAVSYCLDQAGAEQFQAEHPGVLVLQGDVSDEKQVQEMASQIGCVDVLVNNAGFAQQKLFQDITEQEWDRMFSVHVKGSFLCTQAVLPYMIRNKAGAIVNVASIWGICGASCEVHYSAAKGAVIAMTKALAKELGPSGIRVNCLAPGVVDTSMCAHLSEQDRECICEDTPLMRLGTCEEMAQGIFYLATGAFITGQVLSPNGGMVI